MSSHDTQVAPGWEGMGFKTQMITGEDMDHLGSPCVRWVFSTLTLAYSPRAWSSLVTEGPEGNELSLPSAKSTQPAHMAAKEVEGGPPFIANHSFLELGTSPRLPFASTLSCYFVP